MVKLQFIVGAALHATPLVAFPHKGPYFVRYAAATCFGQILISNADFPESLQFGIIATLTIPN